METLSSACLAQSARCQLFVQTTLWKDQLRKLKEGFLEKNWMGKRGESKGADEKFSTFCLQLQQAKKWSRQKMGKHKGSEERNRVNRHFAGRPIVRLNLTLIHGSTIVRWKSSEGLLRWAVERSATKAADSRLSVLTSMKSAVLRQLTRPHQLFAACSCCAKVTHMHKQVWAQGWGPSYKKKHHPDKLVVVLGFQF